MKAVIAPKKDHDNRLRLEQVIPIETPFSLFVEPSDKCNFRCKFCPTSDIKLMKSTKGRNYGNMDFNLYQKIIDDASEFDNNIKLLQLYESGEPLLHPMFPKMVEYAKKSGKFDRIATTTNAYLLNNELSLKIINAGLDRINISIEGIDEEQYLYLSNVKINFNKLVDNIKFFYDNKEQCEISIKIVGNYLSDDDKKKFYDTFGNICDLIFIENIVPSWSNFDISHLKITTDMSMYGKEFKKMSVCPQIFYSLCVHSNGEVSPCCNDWARKVIVGNTYDEKLKDIWNVCVWGGGRK